MNAVAPPTPPTPLASALTEAFALGRPLGHLQPVQHSVSRTWRIESDAGRFLVKELWPISGPDAYWADQLTERRAFESWASAEGVLVPAAVEPVDPVAGWVGRVDGSGGYRVSEWVEHRRVGPEDDLSDWLGRLLATLHRYRPWTGDPDPYYYIHADDDWTRWLDEARAAGRGYADELAARTAGYIALTHELHAVHQRADDRTYTHRDVVPFNVLVARDGPYLVDWDVAGPDSASLETGLAAVAFAADRPERVRRTLESYHAHGGQRLRLTGTNLFAHRVGKELGRLTSLLGTVSSGEPLRGWQLDRGTDVDDAVRQQIRDTDDTIARVHRLAIVLSG